MIPHATSVQLAAEPCDFSAPLMFPALTLLDLSDCSMSEFDVQQAFPLSHKLHILLLSRNQLSSLPVAGLATLTTLDLRWNQFTDAAFLTGLPALKTLNISFNNLTSFSSSWVRQCSKLTDICLNNNRIAELAIDPVEMSACRCFHAAGNRIDTRALRQLLQLHSITTLVVDRNPCIAQPDYAAVRAEICATCPEIDQSMLAEPVACPDPEPLPTPTVKPASRPSSRSRLRPPSGQVKPRRPAATVTEENGTLSIVGSACDIDWSSLRETRATRLSLHETAVAGLSAKGCADCTLESVTVCVFTDDRAPPAAPDVAALVSALPNLQRLILPTPTPEVVGALHSLNPRIQILTKEENDAPRTVRPVKDATELLLLLYKEAERDAIESVLAPFFAERNARNSEIPPQTEDNAQPPA